MRRVRFSFLAGLVSVAVAAGCNSILDFGQFGFTPSDAGPSNNGDGGNGDGGGNGNNEGGAGTDGGDGGDNCNVDLTQACYPCAPQETDQYLNACNSDSTCVGFDRTRITAFLVDGGLPAVPEGGLQQ